MTALGRNGERVAHLTGATTQRGRGLHTTYDALLAILQRSGQGDKKHVTGVRVHTCTGALRAARNKLRGRSCCPQSTTHRRGGAVRGNLVFWCSAFVCRRRNGFAFTHQSENTPLKSPCGSEPTSGCGRPCQHACAMRCASCARAGLAARPMPMDRRREWPWR